MRLWGLVVVVLAVAGCTTFEDMDAGLTSLKGQPAKALFTKLGMPKTEGVVAGRKFYAWGRSFETTMPVATTATTTGTVGSTPYSALTTGTQWQTDSWDCQIRVFVDANDIIESYDYDGNIGGCEAYGKALKR